MRSSINRKRESAERFFWGIIIASAIAIVPAIITGMLDNSDKIEKTVQMVNKIVLGVVVFLALCFIIYQFIKREIQRRERKKRSFSKFVDTIQIIIDYEKGCHTPD